MLGLKSKHLILGIATSFTLVTGVAHGAGKGVDRNTCIGGGTVPAKIRAGQTGFQDEDIKVVEGFSGPEVQIGKARIFQDPQTADDGKGERKDKELNRWCIVDEALSRQTDPKRDHRTPMCGTELFGSEKSGEFFKKKPTITGAGGKQIELNLKELKQPDGSLRYEIMFKSKGGSDSRDKAQNSLYLTGSVKKESEDRRKVRMELQSRDFGDATKVNGNLVSEVTGDMEKNPKSGDPMSGYKFGGECSSTFQAKGQFKNSDKDAPESWVDLSGNRLTMRGNERYIQDQYRAENRNNEQAREVTDQGGRG